MPTVTTEVVGLSAVNDLLSDIPEELFKNSKKEISRSVLNVQKGITKPMRTGQFGLQSRTGNLAKSIQTKVTGTTLRTLGGTVFTNSIYAQPHELGLKITAKNAYKGVPGGPYLNIPLSANKTPAGIMRETPRTVFLTGGFIVRSRNGNWLVMKNNRAMFVLKQSVQLKKTLGMVNEGEDEVPTLLSNLNNVLLEGL